MSSSGLLSNDIYDTQKSKESSDSSDPADAVHVSPNVIDGSQQEVSIRTESESLTSSITSSLDSCSSYQIDTRFNCNSVCIKTMESTHCVCVHFLSVVQSPLSCQLSVNLSSVRSVQSEITTTSLVEVKQRLNSGVSGQFGLGQLRIFADSWSNSDCEFSKVSTCFLSRLQAKSPSFWCCWSDGITISFCPLLSHSW